MAEKNTQNRTTKDYVLFVALCYAIIYMIVTMSAVSDSQVKRQRQENQKLLQGIYDSMPSRLRENSDTSEKIAKKLDLIANAMNLNDNVDAE
ncbi:MAG: hypothetical protein ABGW78_04660 [Pirellulales bacterium]